MSNPPNSDDEMNETGSPEGSPPTTAIMPSALATAEATFTRARQISETLQKQFDELSKKLEPKLQPDEVRPRPDRKASLELAKLGIELASKKKETIQLEKSLVNEQHNADLLPSNQAKKRLRDLNQCFFDTGLELWTYEKKKRRYDDPNVVRSLDPRGNEFAECLLAIYKKSDGLEKARKRPSQWRGNALEYYAGRQVIEDVEPGTWCHISGDWYESDKVKAAHIVPHFLDDDSIGEILFGDRAESLRQAANALLLYDKIKKWFDTYKLVVVPVDATKNPITRWRTDVITSDIRNARFGSHTAKDLDGKELTFLNDKRPASRFLYFHFIMALVRLRDTNSREWRDVWARYYTQRPFPTPGKYMRQSMLLAIATHHATTDLDVVNSWIKGHGFDSPLQLDEAECTEAARLVHATVEDVSVCAEKGADPEEDDAIENLESDNES